MVKLIVGVNDQTTNAIPAWGPNKHHTQISLSRGGSTHEGMVGDVCAGAAQKMHG